MSETVMERFGPWKTVTIAQSGTTSSETDLGAEYAHVQAYTPALDNATITIRPARLAGASAVQAYTFDGDATGDYVNTTTARTTAGMNIFKDIYARYVKIVTGAAQNSAARIFYIRGVELISSRQR